MRDDIAALPPRLLGELEKVIVGQTDTLTMLLSTVLSGGHVLLEDRPGVGKTVLAKALGTVLGVDMGRVQGTPDLLPTDISGVHVFQPHTAEWDFRAGPVFTQLLLVDELNRATPKAQSALLEAMAEKQVTVDGHTFAVPDPFIVIATQNPLGEAGTYPLANAQIDRFAAMLHLGLPGTAAERAVLRGHAGKDNLGAIGPVITSDFVTALVGFVRRTDAAEAIVDYTIALVNQIRAVDPSIWLSVRVSEMLLNVARGHAFMNQRDYVAPEDVQRAAPAVLAHRLPGSVDLAAIEQIIRTVPVPVNSLSASPANAAPLDAP